MKRKGLLSTIGILVVMFFMAAPASLYSDVTLAVPERIQEYSEWCWAGAGQAVIYYTGQYPSQCEIANFAWNSTRCCQGGPDFYDKVKGCNKANWMYGTAGSLEGILQNWGISCAGDQIILSWAESVAELDNAEPFVMRFGWTNGGGHFLVTYGYISSGQYLSYMDPWPGEGYTTSLYSYVVSSSEHDWTHTLTTD